MAVAMPGHKETRRPADRSTEKVSGLGDLVILRESTDNLAAEIDERDEDKGERQGAGLGISEAGQDDEGENDAARASKRTAEDYDHEEPRDEGCDQGKAQKEDRAIGLFEHRPDEEKDNEVTEKVIG